MAVELETRELREVVTTREELRAIVGEPLDRAVKKEMRSLDAHARALIATSPYLLLGTHDAEGRCDVSPKGDAPGFVYVLDEGTIVLPDRPGNRRTDSLKNIVETGRAGLIFLVPGKEETLRVNGRARIVRDEWLLDKLVAQGKRPLLAIVVEIEECYVHCAKSSKRAGIWDPARWPDTSHLASMARMMVDQANLDCSVDEMEKTIADAYTRLY